MFDAEKEPQNSGLDTNKTIADVHNYCRINAVSLKKGILYFNNIYTPTLNGWKAKNKSQKK
jgi:hypothetical protein